MEENVLEDSEESGEENEGMKYQPTVLKSLPADLVSFSNLFNYFLAIIVWVFVVHHLY